MNSKIKLITLHKNCEFIFHHFYLHIIKMENHETKISSRVRVPFTKKEDTLLVKLVKQYGESNWQKVSSFMNNRTVRQCRERWQNSLSPRVLKTDWTMEEDQLLLQKYNLYGPHWKLIEPFFFGRTSYSLRNRFRSIKKKHSEKFNYSQDKNQFDKETTPSFTGTIESNEKKKDNKEKTHEDFLLDSFSDDFNYDIQDNYDTDFDFFHLFDIKEN